MGYTNSDRLAIFGGSNGGLLVGEEVTISIDVEGIAKSEMTASK